MDDIDECAAFCAFALHTPISWFLKLPLMDLMHWTEKATVLMERIYGNSKT